MVRRAGAGELVEWRPVLDRAGVRACPNRVAAVYLELAVLVRALEGLATAARLDARPTARRCGQGCSTCRTRSSGRPWTTYAPWLPDPGRLLRQARLGLRRVEPSDEPLRRDDPVALLDPVTQNGHRDATAAKRHRHPAGPPQPVAVGSAPSIASAWACDSASFTDSRREPVGPRNTKILPLP